MTFFHDLNKRMAELASKQDLNESKVAESEKWIQKAVNPKTKGNLHKALHVAQDETIPKAKIEKATHSKNPKLRHMAQFAKNVAHEDIEQEGNAFTGALKATPKGGKFKVGGKEFKDTSSIEEGQCPKCAPSPCSCNEGNAFTGKLNSTAKGDKFKLGKKEFTDTSSIEEGFKEMDAWMASREKEKGTGKFDRKERTLPGGMKATTYTRKHEDDKEDDSDAPEDKGGAPKKKGRPMGKPKGPERITKGAWKHKAGRKEKTKEDLDTDGVMMTRPTNCSSESIENPGEYDQEGAMAKGDMHTVIRHAEQLEQHLQDAENLPTWVIEKLGQIKGMMTSVSDYIISSHERGAEQATGQEGIRMGEGWRGGMHGEPSVVKTGKKDPNAKVEAWNGLMAIVARGQGMEPAVLKHLKQIARTLKPEELELDEEKVEAGKREFFDRLAPAAKKAAKVIKAIAKNRTPVEEESTGKEDTKAERAGKKVAKDIEHDESDKAKGDNKAEKAGKRVTKDIEYDDKKDKKEKKDDKEEKVEETTVSGSVATATTGGKSSKGGMSFGKGVYESLDKQFKQALTESIQVKSSMEECGDGEMAPALTIQADGEEAAKLMMLLKLAGLENQIPQACPTCGGSPCGCAEVVDENSPDWPTNTEKLDAEPNLRTYSGGLNGPKSSGQTTTPILNRDPRRQASMEESVALERSLFKTWKNYKG